MIDKSELLSI